PVRLTALTQPLPACPAPVPPLAPPVRGLPMAPPAHRRVLAPAVDRVGAAHTLELPPQGPRRRRLARLMASTAVTLAVVCGLGWIGQVSSPEVPTETAVAWVGAGETVWDVARRVAPEYDQRAVVERIRQLNGMAGSAVQPGQQLQVPYGR
ncbi:MAG: LysM peptidoglycan-binding domain-containing protein, partial [Pseudonocardiaceae bacterium]